MTMEPVIINGKRYCPCCSQPLGGSFVPTSITEFIEASDVTDWIGCLTEDVYQVYVQWCIKNEYNVENKIVFMRGVLRERDDLKSVASNSKKYFKWK